jgi:ATP-dependent RNA helicase DeaD
LGNFAELGLSEPLLKSINEMGFEETTAIQERTIPLALTGKDLIGQAQTGTGKTAAFGIPMVENFDENSFVVQGLVLAPTRELAVQVSEELNRIGQFKEIRALPIYGGQEINWQIRALKKRPQIIVATPGRLMDHMRRRTIRLTEVKTVILDEADEMLDMGFIEDIETILAEAPAERQTMMFSATIPGELKSLAERFMKDPEVIRIQAKELTVPTTEQSYVEVPESQKFDVLCRLIDLDAPEMAIVFGRTKRRVDELSGALAKRGYMAEGIHGDLTQARRDAVMRQFREGNVGILVATDVAARGLDISGVTHVYNFDLPQDPDSYVHRIGRTGRAGRTGAAVTFVTPHEIGQLRLIESTTKHKIAKRPMPTLAEAFAGQLRGTAEKLIQVANEGPVERYQLAAEKMLADNDSVTLLAAALKILTKEPDTTPVSLTEESPFRTKRAEFRGRPRSGDQGPRSGHGPRRPWGDQNRRPHEDHRPRHTWD